MPKLVQSLPIGNMLTMYNFLFIHSYNFLGFLNITVRQHFYVKFRIRLRFPKMRCISEEVKTGVFHYYPLGK